MKVKSRYIRITAWSILLMCAVFAAWYFFSILYGILIPLQTEVTVTIIFGVSTILISVIFIILGKLYERKMILKHELREQKIPVYEEEFIDFFIKLMISNRSAAERLPKKEIINFFSKFTQQLMILGSNEVLKKWSEYKTHAAANMKEKHDSTDSMFLFEELLLTIRKDLGHKNKEIKRGELIGLFMNDVNKYVE